MTRRAGAFRCCTLTVLLALGACHRNASGIYLSRDNAGVCRLQIVRTPDNRLTGQLACSLLKPDGTLDQSAAPVTGAVDGENITLTSTGLFGWDSRTFSGTLEGNALRLAGEQPFPITFTRSTLKDYEMQAEALNSRSQSILQQKAASAAKARAEQARRNFISAVDELVGKIERFDSQAELHLSRFPGVEKGYESITAKVAGYVARERQLANNENASVARGQLSVDANQASLLTDQMHNQGQSLQWSLDSDVRPLVDEAVRLEQQCRSVSSVAGSIDVEEFAKLTAACFRLEKAGSAFREKYSAVSAGLAHLEQVYKRERTAQERLLRESVGLH